MMAFIGWSVCVVLSTMVSAYWWLVAWDGLGKYNIGAVPNSMTKKLIIMAALVIPIGAWWAVVHYAPFTVVLP